MDAEQRAARYLLGRGWRILARNWRIGAGELDLVCLEGRTIVFVEVKALGREGRSGPERAVLAVGPLKRERLGWLAEAWLSGPGRSLTHPWEEVRFDVVGVDAGRKGSDPALEHLIDAFRPDALPARRRHRRRGWR